MSRSSVSQTPCSARKSTEEMESCGEKCANLYRVYKLIMVCHVPGYGHLEYLVSWIIMWISSLLIIKFDWVINLLLIGIEMGFTILNV